MNNEERKTLEEKTGNAGMNDLRLGAARRRLAESKDEEDAIEGLREIVANLLGSEEIGLFKVNHEDQSFPICWSFGIDLESYDLLHALGDAGLRRVMRGECHAELSARERSSVPARAQAFIPIRVASETIAILAIFRLLPQKVDFDSHDIELFRLLSEEAAKPLFGLTTPWKPPAKGRGMRA